MHYPFTKIEHKWQKHWLDEKLFKVENNALKPKYYVMDMFPYPSASGLHVGHIEGYTASDIISRFKRMQGYNVLHPMGWDAFGLPAEQYALATGKDPKIFTYQNIKTFKRQLIESGKGIDWDKEFATSDPQYFKWTQWIFKKLFEHGLAEIKDIEVNFCEALGTVLANDEIINVDGKMVSERGNHPVTKKAMRQWVLKITSYQDRLLEDLELVNWPENLKEMQRNWIGKSSGAVVSFYTTNNNYNIDIFTTRPDTLFGVTYIVLAPEHPLALKITSADERSEVLKYIELTKQKSDLDRQTDKSKTGVFTGAFATVPFTNKKIPIWIADYVLPNYGTGAVMAVPAHDERDFEFANIHGLDYKKVIESDEDCFTGDGIHFDSQFMNGLNNDLAIKKTIEVLEEEQIGFKKDTYKLRDWVFSRQRYWGEPFPVLFDEDGKIFLLDDEDLPLNLPVLNNITPSGTGESPLANAYDWVNVKHEGKNFKRDTNTMPQLAGSSWYYIGYILKNHLGMIPLNSQEAKKELKKWLPVDLYVGGTEHAVGHLLYARFWHKFLYDLGIVDTKEPFLKLVNQGMILGPDNQKMSKSRGNVINPDDIIKEYGADTLRVYEMFMGPLEAEKPWQTEGVKGAKRFLDRVHRMFDFPIVDNVLELDQIYHQTVKKVTNDYETLSFNTAISQMMIFVNEVFKVNKISVNQAHGFLQLLNPIAPHLTEELNEVELKNKEELIYSSFPTYDPKYLVVNEVEIAVQVNGKLRGKLTVSVDTSKEELEQKALEIENVNKHLEGLKILKVIVVPNKIVNIVAR